METLKTRDGHETVGDFLVHRFGKQTYLKLMGPLYGGIYGSDPDEMSYEHSLGRVLRERDINGSIMIWLVKKYLLNGINPYPPVTFKDGLKELPEALYNENKDRIKLGKEVTNVQETGDQIRVSIENGESLITDKLVLTSSAADTAKILNQSFPRISNALGNLSYNEIAIVHLRSDANIHGMGFQVSLREESFKTLGCTFNKSIFSTQDVYTSFLGGARNPGFMEHSDEEIMATATDEFREITGEEATPISIHRAKMPAYDLTWKALNEINLPSNLFIPTNYMGRPGIPGRIREAKNLAERI